MFNDKSMSLKVSVLLVNKPQITAADFTFTPPAGVSVLDMVSMMGSMALTERDDIADANFDW